MILAIVLPLIGGAAAVDPCSPSERDHLQQDVTIQQKRWLPARIRQLENEERLLDEQISALPQHSPKPMPNHMGYHTLPIEQGKGNGTATNTIEVAFAYDPHLGAVALVPALLPGEAGSYAFPRRFKIEVLDRGARWIGDSAGAYYIPPPPYEWTEVVNWMDEDFPDPGPYPVFFRIEETQVHEFRMTIVSDPEEIPFCALGEIYLYREQDNSDLLGDNMMIWGKDVSITSSGQLSKPPLWDESYLYDGVVGLGMPLSEEVFGAIDFMAEWEAGAEDGEPVQVVLDLGRIQQVGRVQLWPAQAPHDMAIPQFGFPGKVTLELSRTPDFSDALYFEERGIRERLRNDNLFNILTGAHKVRYLRLTFDDLSQYHGRTILGLGEILVSEYDEVWSLNCEVEASGIPADAIKDLGLLVDGYSRKRRILREVEWIQGLAMRRPLDRRLSVVEQELDNAREAWDALRFRASIWGGAMLCLFLVGAMGLQRLQRRNVLKKLKHRITRDLHDEVGSSLGGITLAARRMESAGASPEELSELSLMAREASASLRDVVWVIDRVSIRLPELLNKLGERATRVLSGMELEIHEGAECPNLNVPLPFKRHLLMFFKEAVHNCARHSQADRVVINMAVEHEILIVSLEDDGCGFDPSAIKDGWGVESMRKRAGELGGEMDLRTAPGKGTTVILTVPLRALKDKTDHSYQTSN